MLIKRRAAIKMKDVELKAQQLTNQNTIAQFEALKNQLSPDVLFQSFRSLSSLIHINPQMSGQLVEHLSEVYRYILDQKDNDIVPLMAELTFMDTYSFLIRIRFGEKVSYENDILKDEALPFSIAPLALQMLVEDAIKHHPFDNGETLKIKTSIEGEYLIVENNLPRTQSRKLLSDAESSLGNIKDRYSLLISRKVEVVQDSRSVRVSIPLTS